MDDCLFNSGRLSEVLRAQVARMESKAEAIPAEHALASSVEALSAELVAEFGIERLQVDWDSLAATSSERQVDVSGDWNRVIRDRSRPFYRLGTTVTYHIPFKGEADLFKYQPSSFTMTPIQARVSGSELIVEKTLVDPSPEQMKSALGSELGKIRQHVNWVNLDVEAFNRTLPSQASAAGQARREKVLRDKELVASLGVPLRKRRTRRQPSQRLQ